MRPADAPSTRALRRMLSGAFLLGTLGTSAELLLLEHYEDSWQKLPLLLLAGGALLLILQMLLRRRWTVRVFQLWSLACLAGGALGVWLHYSGNAEFELEMRPSLAGADLFWRSLHGATPALAPGALSLLGLLGLGSTLHHPVLQPHEEGTSA